MRERCWAVTSATGVPNTMEAMVRCRSSPELNAPMSPSSWDRWAMMRISIWE